MLQAILLGTAQDGGVPQAGCRCAACQAAWADAGLRRWVSALGLADQAAGATFMIDATPDFREQLHYMQTRAASAPLAGLLLTHAHSGHYTGLIHLGFEAMATRGLPLYVRVVEGEGSGCVWHAQHLSASRSARRSATCVGGGCCAAAPRG